MTWRHLPSGRGHGIPFVIPDDWSAEQALAVLELLDDLRECIGAHYQTLLHDLLRAQRAPPADRDMEESDDPPF